MKPYEKVKFIRVTQHKTTYELAKLTGIPQSTISKIENGKRKLDVDTIEKLAKALNTPVSDFFSDTNEEYTPNNDNDMKIIERARNNMSEKDKKKMMDLLKVSFRELFDE